MMIGIMRDDKSARLAHGNADLIAEYYAGHEIFHFIAQRLCQMISKQPRRMMSIMNLANDAPMMLPL